MKKMFATIIITTCLLCNTSGAFAQNAAPAADPRLDVSQMAPNQRAYLVTEMMREQPALTPDTLNKFTEMYKKASPEMQLQMATQTAQQLQSQPILRDKIISGMPAPDPKPAAQK